ncbi:Aste57867_10698 [Aphanomyces stellatus]|uniref:Aste57867_10698 protein n=1 Tax=Aphanomyces stellatus TaxID=120398 RepID=A0A485KR15_9STRA|nr:hypothetical protein As57867_010658 [Aphanomyces stellatus]VFT87568.1 Aste57867_10698 [Aphanomyces stellatus]
MVRIFRLCLRFDYSVSTLGHVFQASLSLFSAFLVAVDVTCNNWEIVHAIGNAKHFFTPLQDITTIQDMVSQYAFVNNMTPDTISKVAKSMLNYTVDAMDVDNGANYFLTANTYTILESNNDICRTLVGTYTVPTRPPPSQANPFRLAAAINQITYIRGSPLSKAFGTADTVVAPKGSKDQELTNMGYIPGRWDLDMRFSTRIDLPLDTNSYSTNVSMYRIFSKSFCSGCDPNTELGLDICSITYSYNATNNTFAVASAKAFLGGSHLLGLVISRTWGTVASLAIRGVCVVFAVVGYAVSKKTVRWTDPPTMGSWVRRIIHTISPTPLYKFPSHTLTFTTFCLDSDLFVLFYSFAIVLDEKNSMVYSRVMNRWNQYSDNSWVSVQLFAMQFRWLWLNCAVLKLLKSVVNVGAMTRYNGTNVIVGFLNLSSVTYVYLSAVLLILRTQFIEYGNTDNVGLFSTTEDLDGIRVDWFQSWYTRNIPEFILVMIVNLICVIALDHTLNRRLWRRLARNSLARQAMFNSTSILSVMYYTFHDVPGYSGQAVLVQARALCTAQWFLLCHTTCFGLAEHPKNIRAMITKHLGSGVTTTTASRRSSNPNVPTYDPMATKATTTGTPTNKYIVVKAKAANAEVASLDDTTQATGVLTDLEETAVQPNITEMVIVAQDPDGHIHLYDARKRELQALSLEIKILGDTYYVVA